MNDSAKGRIVNGERKERRGFASMSPEKQREIASKGGRAAHQKGRGRLVEGPTTGPSGDMGAAPDRAEEFSGQ